MQKALTAIAAVLLPSSAPAETGLAHPLPTVQPFRLDADSGCYRYTGTAGEFTGRFRAGSYVRVTMDDAERIPVMDAPDFQTGAPAFWFGPLPRTGSYSITFTPAYLIGTPGTVEICGRTMPPKTP
ncbi:hypothetical protein [Rhizobium sp. LCM 4573]|uniref:hypothetical protein n=1 Tax=Rhizobium sp. LCM 4573 TaxID=1848291 RepID=UPI0008DA05C1|nr:hypothetical protein [Rhizobium sp. LCM 4573]OHV78407.1 hypothetical protein LCM4573_26690 [Rhizobium sp. LCM 4573]